ncbi:MAG: TraR/DksA family transcriptional regulator [Actinomycetota bacterium]|nr:TraR/DksA family transcriptional regulator [Actinomycetota bacterium]
MPANGSATTERPDASARPAAPQQAAPAETSSAKTTSKTSALPARPATPATRRPASARDRAWSAAELTELRTELDEQARELRAEIGDAESAWSSLQRDGGGEGAGDDQADAGTKTFEREQEMSLANNSRDLLAQVERALARLDDGTYGECESCGNPIGKARLQAFPRATLCVTCKQREERR